jgi:CBS domain-containing protein
VPCTGAPQTAVIGGHHVRTRPASRAACAGTTFAPSSSMKIIQMMTRDVRTCHPSDTLEQAARLMWEHDIGSVVVIDDAKQVIGVVTDRDACMAAYLRGVPLFALSVAVAMSKHVVTCHAEEPALGVARLMAKHKVHRIPVVDDAQRLVGIVSLNDLAIAMTRLRDIPAADVAATLAAISEHRATA